MEKSANQLWKESHTTLSFKDWLEREKEKGIFIPNKKFKAFDGIDLQSSVNMDTINKTLNIGKERFEKELGLNKKPKEKEKNKFFGLNKNILLISGLLIFGAIGYNIYKKNK